MLSAQLKQLRFLNICHRHIVRLSPNGGRQVQNFSTSTKLCHGSSRFSKLSLGWECSNCSFRNFIDRTSCHRCGNAPSKESVASNATNVWPCPGCNVMNYNDRTACFKCGIQKPAGIRSLRGETQADGCWFCAKCEFRNYPTRDTCRRCETKPTDQQQYDIQEKSGIWMCGSCGNKNFRSKMQCNNCNVMKGASFEMNG